MCEGLNLNCAKLNSTGFYGSGISDFIFGDYDQIGERAEDFKRNMVQSGGGISAAIGYALHEEGESVEDVFRRADSTMYENKKRMKRKSE